MGNCDRYFPSIGNQFMSGEVVGFLLFEHETEKKAIGDGCGERGGVIKGQREMRKNGWLLHVV